MTWHAEALARVWRGLNPGGTRRRWTTLDRDERAHLAALRALLAVRSKLDGERIGFVSLPSDLLDKLMQRAGF